MSVSSSITTPVQMQRGGGSLAFVRKVWAIASKDLRSEIRAREVLSVMAAFSVLAVIVFGLAFDLRVPRSEMVVPGVLWVVILFAGVLGLNRSFGAEVDRGSLSALLLAPVDRAAIYFGKLIANLLFMLLTEALVLPTILIIFNVNPFRGLILLSLLLGTIGYVSGGTLFAALAANARARESLLPILLLPVMVPIFVVGVGLTAAVIGSGIPNAGNTGPSLSMISNSLSILIAFDLIFIVVAYLVFDLIWEES